MTDAKTRHKFVLSFPVLAQSDVFFGMDLHRNSALVPRVVDLTKRSATIGLTDLRCEGCIAIVAKEGLESASFGIFLK
jgi:hypothetical protein